MTPCGLASIRLSMTTLRARRLRTGLLIAAAAFAASLIVAVACTMASVQKTVDDQVTTLLGKVDARITHSAEGRFDESIVETVRGWDDVEFATGVAIGSITMMHADARRYPDSDRIIRSSVTAIGADMALEGEIRPLPLVEGRWPESRDEALIDPMAADALQASVGDELKVQYLGEPVVVTVVGIYERKTMGILQRAIVRLDLDHLQRINGQPDSITLVRIGLAEDVDVQAFCDRYGESLDETLLLEPAELVKSGFDRRIRMSELALLIMTMLTFTSAAFIIVTGMTTSVTEQQRELAMLRCIGGSRVQLFAMQLAAGGVIGALGAITGIPLGIALSWLLVTIFRDLLMGGFALNVLGLQLAAIGAVCAGIIGALFPAWQAANVSPLRALATVARSTTRRSIIGFGIVGLVLIVVQVVLYSTDDVERRFWTYVYFGLHAVIIGYFLLTTVVLVVVVQLVARPLAIVLGLPRDFLRASMMKSAHRHGFTAGALMLGMAILVATWASTMSVLDGWVREIEFADAFVFNLSGIAPEDVAAIEQLDSVRETTVIGMHSMDVVNQQVFGVREFVPPTVVCVSFEPAKFFEMNAINWLAGDPAVAIPKLESGEGLIVAERFLTARGITVGDQITLRAGRLEHTFDILGVVESNGLDIVTQLYGFRNRYMEYAISCVFLDNDVVSEVFATDDRMMLQINLHDHVTDEEAAAEIADVAPSLRFISGRWIMQTIDDLAGTYLTVQTTMAFAALLLASIGVGNVILAGVHGRRYEFGVYRSVGGSRRSVVRALIGESVLLALTAAISGTALGAHFMWVDNNNLRDLFGIDTPLRLPTLPTLIGAVMLLIMTILVTLPGMLRIIRSRPSQLLAAGRAG